jgi:hypothetical protein
MANGGANTSRGINRGAAQVYDTSGPVNAYARLMYQQQLRRAAETKALTDELGKVTPEGLRQPDVKGFLDQYGRWRDKSIEANAERNPTRKAILSQEAEKEKLATMMYKDDSKNELINERKRKEFFMNPENRNRYNKEVLVKVINSGNLSKDDKDYIRDINQFEIKPDLTKIRKLLDDTDANLMKYTKPTRVQEEGERLGVKGLYEWDVTTLSPAEQATAYSVLFDTDEGEFKAFLRSLNPEFKDLSEKQLKERGIPILVQERPKSTYSDKKFIEPEKGMTEYQRRRLALAEAGDGGGNEIGNIEVNKEFFGKSTTTASGKEIEKPVKTIKFDYFIKPTQKNFASTQLNNVLNLSTGKNEMMSADTNAALIGLGYTKTKGGKLQVKAVVVNSDKIEFAVNEMDLPIKVRNSDEYKSAKNKLNSEYKRLQQSKPTTKPTKNTTMSAIKSLVGTKGYEGYTEKELVDYYKSQGYTIK